MDPARFAAAVTALGVTFAAGRAAAQPITTRPAAAEPVIAEFAVRAGIANRIGAGPSFPVAAHAGGAFGLGIGISWWQRAGFTLGWERSSIGSERARGDLADVDVRRSLDVLWAGARLWIVRMDRFGMVLQLGPGVAVQHAGADVQIHGSAPYTCSASGGPSLGVRASLGLEARITGPLWITADGVLDHLQASSGPLGDCVPGVGSLSLSGLRLGLTLRHDVTRWVR